MLLWPFSVALVIVVGVDAVVSFFYISFSPYFFFLCLTVVDSNAVRMKKSIRNLITAPQNNFRVFRNGQLVYGDDDDDDDYQKEHVLQSILSTYFGAKS